MIPLPIYPGLPRSEVMGMIKDAKSQIGTDALVKPVRAVIGSPGRILAIGEKPDWICEYAYIKEPSTQSFKEALEWILGIKEDPRGITVIRTLREIFGKDVQELHVTAQSAKQGETK
jgi:hypothetical protein